MNVITYVVVNKELNMSAGKAMAQVAHAVMTASEFSDLQKYTAANQRTIIVLEGTRNQITDLWEYLDNRGIRSDYVVDEGANEIPTMTITALATETFDIEDFEKRDIFRGFKLYKHGWFQR